MLRVGLGSMRLGGEAEGLATLAAGLDAGVSLIDTARAYDASEALVGRVAAGRGIRIVTKCGMTRPEGAWVPDGRAGTVLADARASVEALGRPPDVLLLHAPDPSVLLTTSVRALVRARDLGLAGAIGLSNVTRGQLDALDSELAAAIAAVEVPLGAFDDAAARGGVVAWCRERDLILLAHSPFGGPARAGRLARDTVLRSLAETAGLSAHELVLAYLVALAPCVVPIPGARRPETARSAAAAARAELPEVVLEALDRRFPGLAMVRRPREGPAPGAARAEVVVLMGLAGAGKSRLVARWVDRGYTRLNRDLLGGSLKGLALHLARALDEGASRIILDNTYLTRASRSEVLRIAHRASAAVHCVHLDTPPREAQVNVVLRMLARHGELLGGADLVLRAKEDPNLFAPTAHHRMVRQLEPPAPDEGFASIETVPFVREPSGEVTSRASLAVPLELVRDGAPGAELDGWLTLAGLDAEDPILLFGWQGGAELERRALEAARAAFGERPLDVRVCRHGASGPPVCWCRPPLPGLWLAFARAHGVAASRSAVVVASPAHKTLARTLGLRGILAAGWSSSTGPPPRSG